MDKKTDSYIIRPNPQDPRLTERVRGIDQTGAKIETSVTVERALTIFLNGNGGIQNVVNGVGGSSTAANPSTAVTVVNYPAV